MRTKTNRRIILHDTARYLVKQPHKNGVAQSSGPASIIANCPNLQSKRGVYSWSASLFIVRTVAFARIGYAFVNPPSWW